MNVKTAALVPFLLGILFGCQTTSNTLEQEALGFINEFKNALEQREFQRLDAMLAEDFTYQEPGSPVLSKLALLEREKRGASAGPVSTLTYTIIDASEKGDLVTANVQLEFETKMPNNDNPNIESGSVSSGTIFSGTILQVVVLRRTALGFEFKSVDVLSQTLFRNGQPVGAEAIEEMHEGASR